MRVFSKDEEMFGNYVTLTNVEFGYGQENINKAKIPSVGYTKGKMNQVKYERSNSPSVQELFLQHKTNVPRMNY